MGGRNPPIISDFRLPIFPVPIFLFSGECSVKRIGLFLLSVSCLIAVVLTGCGGGGKSLNGLKTVGGKTSGKGKAVVQLTWPKRGKSTGRLIPQAANSVKVVLLNGGVTIASTVLTRPALNAPTTSAYDFNELAPGNYSASATAYPSVDANSGTAQATVTTPLTITDTQTTTLALTMNTTIARLELTGTGLGTASGSPPNYPLSMNNGADVDVTVTARDGANAAVLTTAGTITFASSNAAIATVSSAGRIHAESAGTATITATEIEWARAQP